MLLPDDCEDERLDTFESLRVTGAAVSLLSVRDADREEELEAAAGAERGEDLSGAADFAAWGELDFDSDEERSLPARREDPAASAIAFKRTSMVNQIIHFHWS